MKNNVEMITELTYEERCRDSSFHFHIHYSTFFERTCPQHTHEFAEFVVVRHGRGSHLIGNHRYPLRAGDIFVVRPEDIHGYEDIDGLDICNMQFDPDVFLDPNSDLQHLPGYHALFHIEPILRYDHSFESKLHVSEDHMHYVYDFVSKIEEEYLGQRSGFQSVIKAYFTLMTAFLAREYVKQETPPTRELLNLSRAISLIEKNYKDQIKLDDLASAACMSKNTLIRSFNRCFNTSPIHYLISHRLSKARELLSEGQQSVTEVAFGTGFLDCSYFTRQFRRKYGVNPSELRKKPY